MCLAFLSRALDFADGIVDGVGSLLSWVGVALCWWFVVVLDGPDVGEGIFDGLLGAASDGGFMVVQPVLHFGFFHAR